MNESTVKKELFVNILDNVEEYLELQKLLHSKLREGYLSVARARISGALPPSPNNMVTLNQRSSSAAADQQQPKWELSTNYTSKPTTSSRREEGEENDTGNSIIHELAAKYGCETPTNTTAVTSKHAQSNSTIEKKAGLISPSLKQAASDFNQALHLLVHMANLQYRLKSQLQLYSPSL